MPIYSDITALVGGTPLLSLSRFAQALGLEAEIAAKLGDTGRILVRESGTEPVIRVMVEAESQEICQEYVEYVVSAIRRKGHCV